MGKKSRIKAERRAERLTDDPSEFDGTTFGLRQLVRPVAFLIGMYVVSFGIGTCTVGRFAPVKGSLQPHPWFILPGVAIICLAFWRRGKRT